MENPKISIIIPIYNTELYLSQCLDSVLSQTLEDIEIICVNDGSTDKSLYILESYALKDKRIKIISQLNSGISHARNVGIEASRCDYLMFVDSDDWIDADTCRAAYEMCLNEDADIVMWSYVREFPSGPIPKIILNEKRAFFQRTRKEYFIIQRRTIGLIGKELENPQASDAFSPVWGKLYKASIIKENSIKFIDTCLIGTSEDTLFNLEVLNHVKKFLFVNENLYHYRKNNISSFTNKYRNSLFGQMDKLFDLIESYIAEKELDAEYYDALNSRIAFSVIGLGLNVVSSNLSYSMKITEVKKIISSQRYKQALRKIDLSLLPISWKIFFKIVKYGQSRIVYLVLVYMSNRIGKINEAR